MDIEQNWLWLNYEVSTKLQRVKNEEAEYWNKIFNIKIMKEFNVIIVAGENAQVWKKNLRSSYKLISKYYSYNYFNYIFQIPLLNSTI